MDKDLDVINTVVYGALVGKDTDLLIGEDVECRIPLDLADNVTTKSILVCFVNLKCQTIVASDVSSTLLVEVSTIVPGIVHVRVAAILF